MGVGMVNVWFSSIAFASARIPPPARRFVLDDRLAVDLCALHHVVAGHEVDQLGVQLLGKGAQQFDLPIHIPAVADDAAQAHAGLAGILRDALEMLLAAYSAIISPEATM